MKAAERDWARALEGVLAEIPAPSQGLPDEVFDFVRRVTPLVNVDLLVRDDQGRHLLAWRDDAYGSGWHIPGGIIRLNEPIQERIAAVAANELGAGVVTTPAPVAIEQLVTERGHFISLLYLAEVASSPPADRFGDPGGAPTRGQLRWMEGVPGELYPAHRMYAAWLEGQRE